MHVIIVKNICINIGGQPQQQAQFQNWESHTTVKMCSNTSNISHISKYADFLSYVFIDMQIPEIKCKHNDKKIFWSKNLAHNICEQIDLNANDLNLITMSSYDLDCHMNYNITQEKYESYNYFIGNRDNFISPSSILFFKKQKLFSYIYM